MTDLIKAFEKNLTAGNLPSRSRAGACREHHPRIRKRCCRIYRSGGNKQKSFEPTVENLRRDPHALNKALIQDYVAFLEKHSKNSTVLHKMSALRAFTNFLHSTKTIEHEPTNGLRLPGKVEPEPRGLNDKDRSRFEAVFQQPWLGPAPKRKRTEKIERNVYEGAVNLLDA